MNFKAYIKELQRRHVVKAGIAYLVGAWLLVQVLSIVIPAFGLGQGWMKTTITILSIGFPIWLIIAWVYDFTPEGIKKTEDVVFDPKVSAKKNLQLNRVIIGGLSIALILLVVNQVRMKNTLENQQAMASMMPAFTSSIAVLAFDDMSPDKDQEYFSDGISEEILNRLAKYKELKVISRTSSFVYKGKDVTIDIIGKELDVAYVLEGSVRKSGDTFRTTVQLIDTRDGSHIWSETFDRKIEDALFTQDEIAGIVAKRLKLTLLNEDVRLRKVDPRAYELYLRSRRVHRYFTDSTAILADSLIRKSLEIDPFYSPAWSWLTITTIHYGLYGGHLSLDQAVATGLDAAKKAIALDSNNVQGQLGLSNWQWHARQGTASVRTLQNVLKKNLNYSGMYNYACFSALRTGQVKNALAYGKHAIQLDPKNPSVYDYPPYAAYYLEDFQYALQLFTKQMEASYQMTGELTAMEMIALMHYRLGDTDMALKEVEKEPQRYWRLIVQIIIYYGEGYIDKADALLAEFKNIPEEEYSELSNLNFDLALIYASQGNIDLALEHLEKAYDFLTVETEQLFYFPELKVLHEDPRWKQLLDRLGEEFNFDYSASDKEENK